MVLPQDENQAEDEAMTDHETSRLADATRDFKCAKCGDIMPRGYRHFERDAGGRLERYHPECARAAKIRARCLEPRKPRYTPSTRPMED